MARASQRIVLRHFLALLFGSLSGVPSHYRFCIYLLDDGSGLLVPWYPDQSSDPDDPTVFKVGQGVTGYAFDRHELVFALGDAVSGDEFHLSPAQKERFANDQIAAAVPIRLDTDEIVGTLSVISHTNDGFFVSEDRQVQTEGVKRLEDIADEIGVILGVEGIELQW